jgi:hypothetical protein
MKKVFCIPAIIIITFILFGCKSEKETTEVPAKEEEAVALKKGETFEERSASLIEALRAGDSILSLLDEGGCTLVSRASSETNETKTRGSLKPKELLTVKEFSEALKSIKEGFDNNWFEKPAPDRAKLTLSLTGMSGYYGYIFSFRKRETGYFIHKIELWSEEP